MRQLHLKIISGSIGIFFGCCGLIGCTGEGDTPVNEDATRIIMGSEKNEKA